MRAFFFYSMGRLAKQHFRLRLDDSGRRSEFMRGIGHELLLLIPRVSDRHKGTARQKQPCCRRDDRTGRKPNEKVLEQLEQRMVHILQAA
ncbi:hypothetical protein D3C76_1598970 [compost metagenome]